MGFKIIEDVASADFIFEASGDTITELFESCALACFTAMTEISRVESYIEHTIEIRADSLDDLLVDYLSELVYLKDTEKIFFADIEVKIDIEDISLKAVASGEPIDYDKHEIKADVKAVTYHGLRIEEKDGMYRVRVILDL